MKTNHAYLIKFIFCFRILGSQPLTDLVGKLTIGAISPGNERFIGYLQDLRIYNRKLKEM